MPCLSPDYHPSSLLLCTLLSSTSPWECIVGIKRAAGPLYNPFYSRCFGTLYTHTQMINLLEGKPGLDLLPIDRVARSTQAALTGNDVTRRLLQVRDAGSPCIQKVNTNISSSMAMSMATPLTLTAWPSF